MGGVNTTSRDGPLLYVGDVVAGDICYSDYSEVPPIFVDIVHGVGFESSSLELIHHRKLLPVRTGGGIHISLICMRALMCDRKRQRKASQ